MSSASSGWKSSMSKRRTKQATLGLQHLITHRMTNRDPPSSERALGGRKCHNSRLSLLRERGDCHDAAIAEFHGIRAIRDCISHPSTPSSRPLPLALPPLFLPSYLLRFTASSPPLLNPLPSCSAAHPACSEVQSLHNRDTSLPDRPLVAQPLPS